MIVSQPRREAPWATVMTREYRSPQNSVAVSSPSEAAFLLAALRYYAPAYLKAVVRRRIRESQGLRTPDSVRAGYDRERSEALNPVAALSWDDVIYGRGWSEPDFLLVDDRIVWSLPKEPMSRILERIASIVAAHCPVGGLVIEFGSGDGRNVLYLKHRFPHVQFVGLELSPVSVRLATSLAAKFGLAVDFHTANVCEPLPPAVSGMRADIVFSREALEMMPRIFPHAIRNMCLTCRGRIALFEPVPELWPLGARGIISRLRVRTLDRLRDLMPNLTRIEPEWVVESAERLKIGRNPLNETCEVRLCHP